MTESGAARDAHIVAELHDAVTRMHVLAQRPRIVVATGARSTGARPMAWQVLLTKSLAAPAGTLRFRGVPAMALPIVLMQGFDSRPVPSGSRSHAWSVERLDAAMEHGPVIQLFRADRLADGVEHALVGVLVFEEDGLSLAGVRALVGEMGLR
jgi:hypothetical protein